ncbi:transcription termination factor 2 isoform X2 [Callorhinchus milii]|uniref:transcription termination factor 2 isoform X2 n=1 Tax=Callorhinchus milii TaxID=7868 RepID=UPI001C3FE4FF|nr:transcription termination factor 2 isoform X2 [Callorhinchus milii]
MERVLCEEHGTACFLKTGVRDGASKGKSFYICGARHGSPCSFTQVADVPVSHCLLHEGSMVELQALFRKLNTEPYRSYYRCVEGKADGMKWCGNIPWQESKSKPSSVERSSQRVPEVSHHSKKQERNPFKTKSENHKPLDWKDVTKSRQKNETECEQSLKHNKNANEMLKPKYLLEASEQEAKEFLEAVKTEKKSSDIEKIDRRKAAEAKINPGVKCQVGTEESDFKEKRSVQDRMSLKPSIRLENEKGTNSRSSQAGEEDKVHLCRRENVRKEVMVKQSLKYRDFTTIENVSSKGQQPSDRAVLNHKSEARCEDEKLSSTDGCCVIRSSQQTEEEDGKESNSVPVQRAKTRPGDSGHCSVPSLNATESSRKTNKANKLPELIHTETCAQNGEKSGPIESGQAIPRSEVVGVKQTADMKKPQIINGQRTLLSFPGFEHVPQHTQNKKTMREQLTIQLKQKKTTLATVNIAALPDKGQRLINQVKDLEDALSSLCLSAADETEEKEKTTDTQTNPFDKSRAYLDKSVPYQDSRLGAEASCFNNGSYAGSSHFYTPAYGATPHQQSLYGGRMTEDKHLAVKNVTSEAIEHLHKSLESCPTTSDEVEIPRHLKVQLLPHQIQALAWLLWRETQQPSGGILADDMGLGKTLTMIAVILAQRYKGTKENKKEEKRLTEWISKYDNAPVTSSGTLVICPASLIYHWKNEIERHVTGRKLSVYLYHGAKREKQARVLSEFDVVVTTYSLVAKELPVKKEGGERAGKDDVKKDDLAAGKSFHSPLLKVTWARIILDEAHNIKNPHVQTSLAVCKLQAAARWAVTGTPIQNNLLDMYSLLKFLRCSPFDEFKLWKNQVDNGTKRGGERLNIITKSLLLRRLKNQLNSSGEPLVSLPQRFSQSHKLKLSENEQAVYNVLFARSRSTLQSYLKRHEGKNYKTSSSSGSDNPFHRVAQEFGVEPTAAGHFVSQKASHSSSTVHILSLLLRLRQCCCHLSLLKMTLEQTEMESEGISLSLEEQMNAMSLTEVTTSEPKSMVLLNGTSFEAELFEQTRESTKITALLTKLKAISSSREPQKSVVVSQWTSMLRVVAEHLDRIKLSYVTIDGSVTPKRRMDFVEEFNTNPKTIQVMLVSLCAGGVGLNLIGGNHLFLLDMHWNPALEEQASDRIYRVGQQKNVTVHRFVCEGTVEDKIFELQEKKKELAKKVLSGTGESFTKLTLADLRILFGV